jgi:hypothetical protein
LSTVRTLFVVVMARTVSEAKKLRLLESELDRLGEGAGRKSPSIH